MTKEEKNSNLNSVPYYRLCHSVKCDIDLGNYGSYGLIAQEKEGGIIKRVDDISTDCAVVLGLVELLNRFKVSSLHIMDVIEDFMASL